MILGLSQISNRIQFFSIFHIVKKYCFSKNDDFSLDSIYNKRTVFTTFSRFPENKEKFILWQL